MTLLGKHIIHDQPDGEYFTLARFRERITKYLYLVEALNPQNGEPNHLGCYLVDLRLLMLHPGEDHAGAKIFDDYAAVKAFLAWADEPPADKVVKLVRPTP